MLRDYKPSKNFFIRIRVNGFSVLALVDTGISFFSEPRIRREFLKNCESMCAKYCTKGNSSAPLVRKSHKNEKKR